MEFKGFKKFLKEDYDLEVQEISEAGFNPANIRRISDLLAKIADKKLGTKFYLAWDESFKKKSGKRGVGYRYLSNKGYQLRFNHLQGKSKYEINSVDFWKPGDAMDKPSLSIYFEPDINIIEVKDQLFDAIKTGKVPNLLESEKLSISESVMERRKSFAIKHGIPVSYAKSKKGFAQKVKEKGLEKEFEDFMSITKNDTEDNTTEREIKKMEKEVEKIYADPDTVFDDIEALLSLIAKKQWKSMIVAGDPGIGKTWHITEGPRSLEAIFGPQGKEWIFHKGVKAAPFSFYKTLFMERDKVIVFDEADSLLKNPEIIMMLKGLLDTSGSVNYAEYMSGTQNVSSLTPKEIDQIAKDVEAEIHQGAMITTGRAKKGQVKLPSKFPFTGSMVFITNMPASQVDTAIMSRSIFFDVALAEQDKLKRVEMIGKLKAPEEGITEEGLKRIMKALGKKPDAPKHEIKYMTPEYARTKKEITVRALALAMKIMASPDIPDTQKDRLIALYT